LDDLRDGASKVLVERTRLSPSMLDLLQTGAPELTDFELHLDGD